MIAYDHYIRRGEKEEDDLLVVINFSPLVFEKYKVGVPYSGKFKEIFNSDSKEFGGAGNTNPRVKTSKKEACDDRENSIQVLIPPMGISIYKCTRVEEKPETKKTAAKKTTAKAAEKKTAAKKTTAKAAEKKTAAKKTTAKAAEKKAAVKETAKAPAKPAAKTTAAKKTTAKKAAAKEAK